MPNRSGRRSLIVRLSDEHESLPFSQIQLRTIGKCILRALGLKRAEASFVFVRDPAIRVLNQKYFKRRGVTDVIAFSQQEGHRMSGPGSLLLGDVVISADRARWQAPRFGHSFRKELVLYMVHGVLHLLGHDDERPRARAIMKKEEERILGRIRRSFPQWLE